MNIKVYIKIAVLLLITPLAIAQNSHRQLDSFVVNNGVLELSTNDGKYLIKPYSDNIVETSFIPTGEVFNPNSHAVIMNPMTPTVIKAKLTATPTAIEFATSGIVVKVDKSPFMISYSYHGKQLTSEKEGYIKDERGETLSFNLDNNEALYGAGARALGMNRRGNRLPLYNKAHYGYEDHSTQMNFSIPLVFSSKMYGIHFDNAPIGYLDLDSKHENTLTYETISGRKTYQLIAGNDWAQLVDNYTKLTGRQPLPPRWAFGNFSSRFGYHSEAEARATVDKFITEKIPLDAIIFDLYWFGKEIKGTMGNLEFDADNFPTPKKMIDDFSYLGVKTILITEPFILTTSKKWDEALQKNILATDEHGQAFTYDFYFGHTGLIDIFNPAGKAWFWSFYKQFTKLGVAGWWGDLGEPEVHPTGLLHQTGSADEMHNIYGHNWAKLIADGYQKDFPEQRPFILMRSGYSGSQRFGMIPWSGDVNRTWGGLQSQPEIALQMGLQGMAYMHSDLGGFAGANLDDELYSRWLQYGVFQPIFRPHAQEEVAAEPVFREQKAKQLAKAAIELRYQLLPYNYTLAFENNQQGLPLMRPLFYEEPQHRALYDVANSYLWGHEFLVKPVLDAGITATSVYFPRSANWFDFYTGQRYLAGTTQAVAVTQDHIPVFVRAGAFIPMIDVIQNTEHYSIKAFNLHYFDDTSVPRSTGKLYDDDGKTPNAFEKDAYSLLQFNSERTPHQLSITLSEKNGVHYQPVNRTVTLIVHNIYVKPGKVLLQSNLKKHAVNYSWDEKCKTLFVSVPLNQKSPAKLVISLSGN
ncbi:TIM-barrel domain-containing protein [Solimicrobium silvestre]|uniref:Alpha-glucosidases family 31 of glycosyl hydrolase n=1 Tax=Solimicrobium silvestre TaxID=2099400 RepID=A0A2S9H5E3_9BURK|nr:TIM-barrel domain-containing protein [Solimicrobium silvestre]PRC95187.1 Alpha-glucosidases family 31 of glycosyl hydrolase [Solimicrobium silvestre]